MSFPSIFELSSLNGSNGFTLNGINAANLSGYSVSSAGDVNGDGVDDLIIGAHKADPSGITNAGQSYVVFGKTTGFSASLELSSLDGSNGFTLNGINSGHFSGYSVSSAGDVNGDGVDDLIIGAPQSAPNGISFDGQSYVVFGKTTGFSASLDLSSLDGSNGFTLNGINVIDGSGNSVSSAGDVNGDGVDDLIIGAERATPSGRSEAGQSYVVFGKTTGFSASLELSSLDGSNGFTLNGINAEDASGYSVSRAGDVNGDGIDDLIIGAFLADPSGRSDAGQSYVVFGKTTGFSASLDLSSLDGSNGFILNGINMDHSGFSVSRAGDVNGDSIDDLIIGAPYADPGGRNGAGQSYVVFGQRTSHSPDFTNDGKTDILWHNRVTGENGYWEMDGAAFVTSGLIDPVPVNSGWAMVGTGDFTGDGNTDILWRNHLTGDNRLWEMDGSTFVQQQAIGDVIPVNSGWDIVGTGDFTNDGKTDILWHNRISGESGYWEMNGTTFVRSGLIDPVVPVNSGWDIVGAGDFTNDGKTDIVWHNRFTGDSGFWEMNGTQLVKGVAFDRIPVETGWHLMGAGDFNQDGAADLFWQNHATGDTGFWLMQGATRTEGIVSLNIGANSGWAPIL